MKLDDTQPCPGRWRPFKNCHAGICIACARWDPATTSEHQIAPAAVCSTNGEWSCSERRFHGVHGLSNVQVGQSLERGPA